MDGIKKKLKKRIRKIKMTTKNLNIEYVWTENRTKQKQKPKEDNDGGVK